MIALMSLTLLAGCGSGDTQGSGFSNLNSFTAKTLYGEEITEEIFADADITVINCWATWCGPCVEEMPQLAEFAASLPDNVRLITFCLDGSDNPATALDILNSAGFKGTSIMIGNGDLKKLSRDVQYIPTTVFVDSSGNMVGESIIGAPQDLASAYKDQINSALTELGKPAI